MRILNITAQRPDSTGSGVYLAETVRCQTASGHEAAVVAGVGAHDEPFIGASVPCFPVRFDTDELPFHIAGMSDVMPYPSTRYRDMTPAMTAAFVRAFEGAIARAAEAFRPDAVLCHHLYLVTALARETLPDVPVCAVCHSTDIRQMKMHGLERERIIAAARRLDAVLALHEDQKAQIVELYGVDEARVHVVGTGFNAAVFNEEGAVRDAEGALRTKPFEIMYAGKICGKKGVPSLLEALDAAARSDEARRFFAPAFSEGALDGGMAPFRLNLVGGHSDEAEYERIVERARACRFPVELPGRIGQDELVAAYRASDVFVLPSFYEGLPLVIAEALACGCKAVTTDLPGVRSWYGGHVPGASVLYVEPPRMTTVDEPLADDLPAFEARLARAVAQACMMPRAQVDMAHISWEGLTERIVSAVRDCIG
ncbi:glycosyl transferase family 1 [Slackia faecicanis]|uniref:Glycosyl transferase family 1 n=1 Tax=Slackia faecicanis TaxID=255723 RepID=A0A3N0AFZ5_9ACTN|nr:glycosyltransferase family 4 protein [Slackia faecicanis]RNL19845.1 glycosyl transferase family 1 [Slackia faecicanis]